MMGTPEKVIKVHFKTNNTFNFTMMASFLPVSVRKKPREKYAFYCSVSQIHINPEKNTKYPIQMTFCDVPNVVY